LFHVYLLFSSASTSRTIFSNVALNLSKAAPTSTLPIGLNGVKIYAVVGNLSSCSSTSSSTLNCNLNFSKNLE